MDPPWASMQPRQIPPSVPLDETELKLVKAFKRNHYIYATTVTSSMDMISTRTICKKCLLFTNICQTVGYHVMELDEETQRLTSDCEF